MEGLCEWFINGEDPGLEVLARTTIDGKHQPELDYKGYRDHPYVYAHEEFMSMEKRYQKEVDELRTEPYNKNEGAISVYIQDQLVVDFIHNKTESFTKTPFINFDRGDIARLVLICESRRQQNLPISHNLIDFLVSGATRCLDENEEIKKAPTPWPTTSSKTMLEPRITFRVAFLTFSKGRSKGLSPCDFRGNTRKGSKQITILGEVAEVINGLGLFKDIAVTAGGGKWGLTPMIKEVLASQADSK